MRYLLPLLLLASPLSAQQRKPIDYALATVTTGLLVADWSQTLQVARHAEGREGNPLLGVRPSVGRVNTYFSVVLLADAALLALPAHSRRIGYGIVASIEAAAVLHNLALGWRIGF